ncbi:Initiator Replication protein [Orenia metallireducens]|uniref:Initiator Replication protein n=1 Tax=Orenia metallireducens TaxID=1413210 RepID=A0A285HZQ8_9FIRM|nr:replication initiation protein [Orenia metallireducens]SNY41212.1 Initiator Replication protein [Orenia metallireducens]
MKKEVIVKKPNQLISILPKESISLIQQKSYNVFLRNAQNEVRYSKEEIKEDKRYIFEISCRKLEQKAGLNKKNYDYLEEELQKLMSIVIKVIDKENKDNWKMFHLLDEVDKEDNVFKYVLNPLIVQALKEQTYFTKLDLLEVAKLDSKYSVILYELAIRYYDKRNPDIKIPKMSIEELRKRTNTEQQYKRFYNFRKNVLDKACKEISKKTDINLSYSTEKIGRRIAYINFRTKRKEVAKKEIESRVMNTVKEYSPKVLELFNLLPQEEQVEAHKKEIEALLAEHSFRYLKADIEYAKEAQPDNFIAFLKASCKNSHYSSAELEKQEMKKELGKKREEEKKKKEELEKRIGKKAREMALEKYELLTEVEVESYKQEYDKMAEVVPESIRPAKEDYIIGALEDKFKEELKELLFS